MNTASLTPNQVTLLRYWPGDSMVMPDRYVPDILPLDQAKAGLFELVSLGLATHTMPKRGWYKGRDVFRLTEAGLNRAANL